MTDRADRDAQLAGRRFLAVFAHPDDESLACGGTIARLTDAGAKVVLLCASRGERGTPDKASTAAREALALIRARELDEAARVLGIAEVSLFNHPDGNLQWADVSELHAEIVSAIEQQRPDGVITFDEDGLYWHLDHIGVHERTYTAVCSLGASAPPLYYVTMPQGAMRRKVEQGIAEGWVSPDVKLWGIAPGVFGHEIEPPTFTIDVRRWVPRKLAALRCHRSQMADDNPFTRIDDVHATEWLGIEQFRRAPIEGSGESLLEALGDPVVNL